ncbi:neutral zinc metallopeptidase [Actinoplanes oblitus]|uniref:Neutral zinc metallopeptidase n=1 Tax=Actinoplanes oblitus TaxID=3040509 RepID=A0ABY8W7L4_9ACTN|nr:neutral zinc metallopeptidase [Actinoplanes oblitus]WIM93805.1 neutral zinc metallopeptidase [Actinoplanes oblitus]
MSARIAAVLVLLLLVGCGALPSADDDPVTRRSTPRATGSVDLDGTDTPEEFAADIDAAQRVAEQYWTRVFAKSGDQFEPVRELVPYERAGEVSCGDEPLPLNNAAYCSRGDFIAYDVNWAFGVFRQIGDAFLYYLLGHEYAHGIQARLGIQKEFTIQQELQADCMAGAFIGDQARARQLRLDKGDTDELAEGLKSVGDAPGQPWFAEGSHGSPEMRVNAFANGYRDSLRSCDL